MRIENIDIEGKSSKEFSTMVRRMLGQVDKFIERGEKELGLKTSKLLVVNVEDEDANGIYSVQMLEGEREMLKKTLFSNDGELTALGELGHMYSQCMIEHLVDDLEDDDDE